MGSPTIYVYERCGTCRKALRWLTDRGVAVRTVSVVGQPPDRATLESLWRRSGSPLRRLFNTSGKAYRAGGFARRLPGMSEAEALDALAADGMLLKRPVLDAGEFVLVGFDEAAYARGFAG